MNTPLEIIEKIKSKDKKIRYKALDKVMELSRSNKNKQKEELLRILNGRVSSENWEERYVSMYALSRIMWKNGRFENFQRAYHDVLRLLEDKDGRRLYKFSSSVAQGGYLYAHKMKDARIIKNSEGLRNLLQAIAKKHELIDVTIKVYSKIFFLFFQSKPSLRAIDIINNIQEHIGLFGTWDNDYLWTGVYDLQERYVREYLQKGGYNYDKG